MSLPTLQGGYGPDPEDLRNSDEFGAITERIRSSSVTEPFAPGYEGNIEPIDWQMYQMLGSVAENRAFALIIEVKHRIGDLAVHYNPDTVGLN